MKTTRHGIVLLLAAEGGPTLAGISFRLGVPHQASMLAPLPEVHAPGDPGPDFLGPAENGLPELPREHCLVKTPGHGVVLLLAAEGGPTLAGSPFRLGIPYQASMLSLLPEVHAPGDPCPDIPVPADAQRLSKNDVGEDEGSLGVPTP